MGTSFNLILEQWREVNPSLYLVALSVMAVIGFFLLFKGGEWLTNGASGLAKGLGASPVVIGLTIVSMATSAPELFTCLTAAIKGSPDLVVGNLVGSNLANIGLILGFALMLSPMKPANALPSWQMPFLMVSSLAFTALCLFPLERSVFSQLDGYVCIALMLAFLFFLKKDAQDKDDSQKHQDGASTSKCLLLLIAASVMLWVGSEALVKGSIGLAREADLNEAIIGLTLIAIGTSLPELAASYSLARRSEYAILLGNVAGSNVFNLLLVGGVTGIIHPFSVSSQLFEMEFPAMLFVTALMWALLHSGNELRKPQGILLLTIYFTAITVSILLHN